MATFTWTAEFGSNKVSKPNISNIRFGDGYVARQAHGINNNAKMWELKFQNRDISEIDAIEAFLDARGAVESFDWTPPRGSDPIRVICQDWSRSIDRAATDSLTAKFEQVFEP